MAKAAATTAMALATVALTCNGYGKAAGHAAAGTEAYHEITFELDHPVGAGLSHHQPHWCPHDMPIVWKRLAMRKLVDCQTSAIDAVDGCRHRHREVPTCVSVEGCEESAYGYEPTWAGQVEAQPSPHEIHALIGNESCPAYGGI